MESRLHIVPIIPDLAQRTEQEYLCPTGHTFTIVFAAGVTIPSQWDCPRCGRFAWTEDQPEITEEPTDRTRGHWDMLLERRTIEELDQMLEDRILSLRAA